MNGYEGSRNVMNLLCHVILVLDLELTFLLYAREHIHNNEWTLSFNGSDTMKLTFRSK